LDILAEFNTNHRESKMHKDKIYSATETQSQPQGTTENLGCLAATQGLNMSTSRTKRTRPTFGGQPGEQTLDATLATSTTASCSSQPGNFLNGFRFTLVNRL
jgi:hypothetical protein